MNVTNGIHRGTTSASGYVAPATCPACASPITQDQYDQILRINEARQKQLAEEEGALLREREELVRERAKLVEAAVADERAKWARDAALAKEAVEREKEALARKISIERDRTLAEFEKRLDAEVRRRERQERDLARERARMEAKAKAEADTRLREAKREIEDRQGRVIDGLRDQLKTVEERRRRDEEGLKRTISELQQKAEARDRGHFGPEGEEELIAVLRQHFSDDRIEHHGKNGDVVQTVFDVGKCAGTIVFEVKKRRTWERSYVRQLKLAMESRGTRYGVVVTRVLPSRNQGICVVDGVLVTTPALAAQVTAVVRDGIIALSRLRLSEEGKAAKTVALFDYLRSEQFSTAIQRLEERVKDLRESLTRERAHHDGWWRAREQHYAAILRDGSGIGERVREILGSHSTPRRRGKALAAAG